MSDLVIASLYVAYTILIMLDNGPLRYLLKLSTVARLPIGAPSPLPSSVTFGRKSLVYADIPAVREVREAKNCW